MRLGQAHVKNFQSYKDQEFNFEGLGLALIAGPTRSGKSTLFDIASWIVFGVNSKESAADDVRAWFADGPTEGSQEVFLADGGRITVYRIRGSASQNDLYWTEHGYEKQHRGKDLKDTQRLIEERIGVSGELYLLGSYLHQFSQAESFFLAKAKDRREVFEKVADLSIPMLLGERASEARKVRKRELEQAQLARQNIFGQLESAEKAQISANKGFSDWESNRKKKVEELLTKSKTFESDKNTQTDKLLDEMEELDKKIVDPKEYDNRKEQLKTQIKALDQAKTTLAKEEGTLSHARLVLVTTVEELERLASLGDQCPTCLGPTANKASGARAAELEVKIAEYDSIIVKQEKIVGELQTAVSSERKIHSAYDKIQSDKDQNAAYIREFETRRAKLLTLKEAANIYEDQARELTKETNPFMTQVQKSIELVDDLQCQLKQKDRDILELENIVASLNWLYDKSFELRAYMLERAKTEIADKTNALLEKYFDASLKIKLTFEGQDKLEASISNDGFPCPYRQLSGGERDMLRLCFWLSLSKQVENNTGVKFGTLMIDEALKSLDPSIKTKVFGLLQTLESEYNSVLLIDHHLEFQTLFENKFSVTNNGGISTITHE